MEKIIKIVMSFVENIFSSNVSDDTDLGYDNRIVVKYIIYDGKQANGLLYFKDLEFEIISGPYGDGYMAKGNYCGYIIKDETRKAFTTQSIGWQMSLRNTDTGEERGYGIHPDGGVKVGTKGCIGCNFKNQRNNILLRNMIRTHLEVNGKLEVVIV